MIFYFSGTGNSLYAAQKISRDINERLISIAGETNSGSSFEYSLAENEVIGFVYPVYAWRAPSMVVKFIRKMKFKNYRNNYIFSVCTCGDEEGYTTAILKKRLARKGFSLSSGFTVVMPNNYIISYDLDPRPVAEKKLAEAEEQFAEIIAAIGKREDGLYEIKIGPSPFWKSYIINPLFEKYALDPKKFFATDVCTGCGLCAEVCNTQNITVNDKPAWGSTCIKCLACIHRCPEEAIQYDNQTAGKGRYLNPNCQFPA